MCVMFDIILPELNHQQRLFFCIKPGRKAKLTVLASIRKVLKGEWS